MRIENRVNDFISVPEELAKCGNALTGNEIKLWITLKFIANSDEEEISENELFSYCGWCRETTFRHLSRLEEKGLIVRNKKSGRKGWNHTYTMNSLKSWFQLTGRKLREEGKKKKKATYPGRDYIPRNKN